MEQIGFPQTEFAGKKRVARREQFLAEMEKVVAWQEVLSVIDPYYPNGERGRPSVGVARILRMCLVQHWYHLSDEGVEDALTDSQSLPDFVGIDLSRESVPDATTLLDFRHLMEERYLNAVVLDTVEGKLSAAGLLLSEGMIADATIIRAPPLVKNEAKARDPEMHQTKKGNQWHFRIKAHIRVDAGSGLVDTVVGTAANVADVTQTAEMLHGEEKTVYVDAGCTGAEKREDLQDRDIDWQVATTRSKLKAIPKESKLGALLRRLESVKGRSAGRPSMPFTW